MNVEHNIGYNIRRSNIFLDRLYALVCKKNNVQGGTQGRVLRYLFVNKDRDVFQKDLEKRFSVRSSTMSVILDSLEKTELIKRVIVDNDSRFKKIVLTKKGEEESIMMDQKVNEVEQAMRESLSEKDIETFIKCFSIIIQNIEHQIEKEEL